MIAGGKILDGLKSGYWGMVYKGFYKIAPESGYVSSIIGCNMAMRKEFLANNKFDETLKYGADETELCIRAAKFGYKVFFNEEAKVVHYHRNTLKSAIIQSFGLGAGNCYCKFKHGIFPPITLKSVILLLFIFCVIFVRWPLNLYLSLILTTCFVPLVFLVDIAKREKNPRELILSFPARFIMIIADSAGRIYGAYKYVTSRLKKHIDKDIMLL
jgi:GT2 family glycosyltransferase